MEKANLDPKHWTMQGEVTATKRPKNSALEVDLDFEHNVRPPPVITEEVTASLEDMIKSRIIEARFDDVQPAPSLPTKSKREVKELHDSKSKKGLAEVYEEEYVQKSNPLFAPSTFSDELKKEVIEEMSIQTNVPAIAMEEVAPVAVSDAAMLAPEEIFSGTGKIKEESELTQEERKRRRAKKKRKFKAESAKQPVKKARDTTSTEMSKTVSVVALYKLQFFYISSRIRFCAMATTGVRVTEGEGNLPKLVLTSPDKSEAEIYLFGGCVTSWKVASGKDLLFVRPDAVFNKIKPISGGIPHCFPQFGPGVIQQVLFFASFLHLSNLNYAFLTIF
ncbi:hypothetical protein F2Q68_00035586 [Brassica cretica]|uniref:Uncharacterized protein n=1 Tax=Brassica cretica TaxID=69181 RepID=A0A8S9H938_BRACR|nr:hypothetical protein F2Q68_00035586 [Brassica cretica]